MLMILFFQVMRKHVMVRVGGGWDTLERYFDKHDPCKMSGEVECQEILWKNLLNFKYSNPISSITP